MAEAEEGSLWVLSVSKGQLGVEANTAFQPTLIQAEGRSEGPLRCLAALYNGMILIDSQGAAFSAGDNTYGQLGRSSEEASLQRIENIPPMLAASFGFAHALALDENGGVWTWGSGEYGQLGTGDTFLQNRPVLVPSLGQGMSALLTGGFHSLVFPQEGGLLVFGFNYYGQLGLNHTTNQTTPTLCPLQPALPRSLTCSRNKSARFL